MRIKCCCITCFIGEDAPQSAEEQSLIPNEKESSESTDIPPRAILSPTKSVKDSSTDPEEVENADQAADILKKHNVSLGPQKSDDRESFNRAVGILKRYKISSTKYDPRKLEKELSTSRVDLKVSIKMMVRSDVVKIFAIEATNVIPVLQEICPETDFVSTDELVLVQIRTKILPTDVRGHSKKFEVYESLTGAMKFANECLHTMTITEFVSKQVRFRLYNVFKQKRDILLGEYILDIPSLNLDVESCTMNVVMQLHEPGSEDVQPPEVMDTRRLLSSTSGSSNLSSSSSNKSFKATTIRRGDTRTVSRRGIPVFSDSSEADQGDTKTSTTLQPVEEGAEVTGEETSSPQGAFQQLIKGVNDRTENVEKLEDTTEEMAREASAFSDMTIKLREKYQKKYSKKKLK